MYLFVLAEFSHLRKCLVVAPDIKLGFFLPSQLCVTVVGVIAWAAKRLPEKNRGH